MFGMQGQLVLKSYLLNRNPMLFTVIIIDSNTILALDWQYLYV